MTPTAIIALAIQIVSLVQQLTPAALQAIEDFKKLFADGATPTQADVDALIDRVKNQSAEIQALDDKPVA